MENSSTGPSSSQDMGQAPQASAPFKPCTSCGEPIPVRRLSVLPNATLCVPCTEAAGDVALIKRFDDRGPDGEVVSTMFTKNRRFEGQLLKRKFTIASEEAFNISIGDDSHLVREWEPVLEHGYSMREFEEEPEPPTPKEILAEARSNTQVLIGDVLIGIPKPVLAVAA